MGAAFQPAISMHWVRFDGGTYGVEMLVSGLTSEAQAEAAMALLQKLYCGAPIEVPAQPPQVTP